MFKPRSSVWCLILKLLLAQQCLKKSKQCFQTWSGSSMKTSINSNLAWTRSKTMSSKLFKSKPIKRLPGSRKKNRQKTIKSRSSCKWWEIKMRLSKIFLMTGRPRLTRNATNAFISNKKWRLLRKKIIWNSINPTLLSLNPRKRRKLLKHQKWRILRNKWCTRHRFKHLFRISKLFLKRPRMIRSNLLLFLMSKVCVSRTLFL